MAQVQGTGQAILDRSAAMAHLFYVTQAHHDQIRLSWLTKSDALASVIFLTLADPGEDAHQVLLIGDAPHLVDKCLCSTGLTPLPPEGPYLRVEGNVGVVSEIPTALDDKGAALRWKQVALRRPLVALFPILTEGELAHLGRLRQELDIPLLFQMTQPAARLILRQPYLLKVPQWRWDTTHLAIMSFFHEAAWVTCNLQQSPDLVLTFNIIQHGHIWNQGDLWPTVAVWWRPLPEHTVSLWLDQGLQDGRIQCNTGILPGLARVRLRQGPTGDALGPLGGYSPKEQFEQISGPHDIFFLVAAGDYPRDHPRELFWKDQFRRAIVIIPQNAFTMLRKAPLPAVDNALPEIS